MSQSFEDGLDNNRDIKNMSARQQILFLTKKTSEKENWDVDEDMKEKNYNYEKSANQLFLEEKEAIVKF